MQVRNASVLTDEALTVSPLILLRLYLQKLKMVG